MPDKPDTYAPSTAAETRSDNCTPPMLKDVADELQTIKFHSSTRRIDEITAAARDEILRLRSELSALRKEREVAYRIDLGHGYNYYDAAPGKLEKLKAQGRPIEPLFAHPPAVPEGWKMVPVEPTDEMLDAGIEAAWPSGETIYDDKFDDPVEQWIEAYRAMLSASPTHQVAPTPDKEDSK